MAESTAVADVKLSGDQLTDLRRQVEENRDEALSSRADWPSAHAIRYRRYLADPALRPPGPWPGAPQLFISVTRAHHEKLHGVLWNDLANLANVRLKPFGEEDAQGSTLATRFLRWTLSSMVDWAAISHTMLFDALLDSASVVKVVAWKPPWEAPPLSTNFFDRIVRIDPLDQGMLLVPPDAEGLQYPEARYLGQEFHLSTDDLWRMRHDGYDIPDPDSLHPQDQSHTERQEAAAEHQGISLRPFHKDTHLFVEQYERFLVDRRSHREEDLIVSWLPDADAGDGTTSRKGKITRVRRLIDVYPQDDRPRRPFFPLTVWPQPRQWRGMNVPDRLESMQDLINRLHEQLVNYGEVSMLPYVFANTFLTGELPDLRAVRPGSTVPIEDVNGVQFAPTRSLNRHFAEQIQLALANAERDDAVTDFNLGRQPDRANAPRTASATMALLGESRKAFGTAGRHIAGQAQHLLSFYFRLWQEVLPPTFRAPVQPMEDLPDSETRDMLSRLFQGDLEGRMVATSLSREQLSGIFDAEMQVNPEAAFDKQVLISLAQMISPAIQPTYAMGQRELLKRIWEAFEQKGFEQIYPQHIAAIQTQIQSLTQQLQMEQLRTQLQQMQAARQQMEQQAAMQQQAQEMQAMQAQGLQVLQDPAQGGTRAPFSRAILQHLQQQAARNGGTGAATSPEGMPPV